ncbi:MAG: hypothetical protein HC875_37290 [Anaerolineales bacterium]|nr:hypothetical protein [Anaerolineales bacterium]
MTKRTKQKLSVGQKLEKCLIDLEITEEITVSGLLARILEISSVYQENQELKEKLKQYESNDPRVLMLSKR